MHIKSKKPSEILISRKKAGKKLGSNYAREICIRTTSSAAFQRHALLRRES